MAMVRGSAGSSRPLTVEGIDNLISGLDDDLTAVEASALPDPEKQDLRTRISVLMIRLMAARNDFANIGDWIPSWPAAFLDLSTRLKQALPALFAVQGACHYDGGCIVTTQTHCDELHGDYEPGVDCEGNPLP